MLGSFAARAAASAAALATPSLALATSALALATAHPRITPTSGRTAICQLARWAWRLELYRHVRVVRLGVRRRNLHKPGE